MANTPLQRADQTFADIRASLGLAHRSVPLLTAPNSNVKFSKTARPVYGLALAPHADSVRVARAAGIEGGSNVCSHSTPACRAFCVSYAGNGGFQRVTIARSAKNVLLNVAPEAFYLKLERELSAIAHLSPLVRLNTFSDLAWETIAPQLFSIDDRISFYDYTKRWARVGLDNYHLTYSASERTSDDEIRTMCAAGANVAVVFSPSKYRALPTQYLGIPVADGDMSDDRTLDPAGVIVGLRAKGKLRTAHQRGECGGFVRNVGETAVIMRRTRNGKDIKVAEVAG